MGRWSALRKLLRETVDLSDGFARLYAHTVDYLGQYVIPRDVFPSGRPPVVLSHREVFNVGTSRFAYEIGPPPLAAKEDVVGFKLYAAIDNVDFGPFDVAPGGSHELEADQGANITVHFTSVDESDNESRPGPSLQWIAVDDIPPSSPDAPNVISHRELFVDETGEEGGSSETEEGPFEPGGGGESGGSSMAEEPVIDEEPVVDEPVVDEPVDEPVVDEPVVDEPLPDVTDNAPGDDEVPADEGLIQDDDGMSSRTHGA